MRQRTSQTSFASNAVASICSESANRYVALDILCTLVLVITDRFSKLTRAVPLKRITALSVAHAFVDHLICYGTPAKVLSDNGSHFTSRLFQLSCTELKAKTVFTTTNQPQTIVQCERVNRTMLAGFLAFIGDHRRSWHKCFGLLTYAYNTQVHPSLGVTPFDLVLSRRLPTFMLRRD